MSMGKERGGWHNKGVPQTRGHCCRLLSGKFISWNNKSVFNFMFHLFFFLNDWIILPLCASKNDFSVEVVNYQQTFITG